MDDPQISAMYGQALIPYWSFISSTNEIKADLNERGLKYKESFTS